MPAQKASSSHTLWVSLKKICNRWCLLGLSDWIVEQIYDIYFYYVPPYLTRYTFLLISWKFEQKKNRSLHSLTKKTEHTSSSQTIFNYKFFFLEAQVCAFILVYEQWMSNQPEVEDSPTIFVPLNTPALYRVDQLKGFLQSLESRAFQITCCRLNCSTFRNMKSQLQEHIIGIPVSCQYDKPSLSNGSGAIIQSKTLSLSLSTLHISC